MNLIRRGFLVGVSLVMIGIILGFFSVTYSHGIRTHTGESRLTTDGYYQRETGAAPYMMKFIGFPKTPAEARSLAGGMAKDLQTWHKAGVRPIVIMEPSLDNGRNMMDLTAFNNGAYDQALSTFFSSLKQRGVSDGDMGMWVPFPEPNDPGWANNVTDPQLFVGNFTKVAKTLRQSFPKTPVSVLLDSQTSLKPDYSDATMDPNALLKYLNYEPGLVTSFGLQGFSWNNNDAPSTYLSAQAAALATATLGVKHVWFNTGTFSKVNNPNGQGIISASDERRAQLLGGVLQQAVAAQAAGLSVDYINVFGQNTFDAKTTGTGEFQYGRPAALNVLKNFVVQSANHQIPVTIFDTRF